MGFNVCAAVVLAAFISLAIPVSADEVPSSFNLSGALYGPDDQAITAGSVDFRIEIWDAGKTCVLYREDHENQNLAVTKGRFSFEVGRGVNRSNFVDTVGHPNDISAAVFKNSGVTSIPGCGNVNLASASQRLISIFFRIGGGAYIAMDDDVPMSSSAWSMVAETLGGKKAAEFINVNNNGTTKSLSQANVEEAFSFTNWPKLKDLLDGNSAQYMGSTPTAAVGFNGQRISNIGTPSAAGDAVNKSYSDGTVGGRAVDFAAVSAVAGNGHTVVWDQAGNRWTTAAPAWAESGGNAYRISGNVGIGTSTPSNGVLEIARTQDAQTKFWIGNYNPGAAARSVVFIDADVAGVELTAHSSTTAVSNFRRPAGVTLATRAGATGGLSLAARNAASGIISFHAGGDVERARIAANGNVGIGTTAPQSELQVSGYTQLGLTTGAPPAADCDAAAEYGRMKIDANAGVSRLYICTADGWIFK